MIFTVTTSTVSAIPTGSLALIGILVLFALLLQKELATSSSSKLLKRLSGALDVAVLPMLIAFVMIVIVKVFEVLQ